MVFVNHSPVAAKSGVFPNTCLILRASPGLGFGRCRVDLLDFWLLVLRPISDNAAMRVASCERHGNTVAVTWQRRRHGSGGLTAAVAARQRRGSDEYHPFSPPDVGPACAQSAGSQPSPRSSSTNSTTATAQRSRGWGCAGSGVAMSWTPAQPRALKPAGGLHGPPSGRRPTCAGALRLAHRVRPGVPLGQSAGLVLGTISGTDG